MSRADRQSGAEAIVLTKALVRASDRLGISQKVLASIIGLSEASVSRMQNGSFILPPRPSKAFELAQLLLQLYELLDRLVAGDQNAAKAWLGAENLALRGRPIELIQRVRGLVEVIGYLRASSSR